MLAIEGAPPKLIESKFAESNISSSLHYFHGKYNFPALQIVRHLRNERIGGEIEVRRAYNFLRELKL